MTGVDRLADLHAEAIGRELLQRGLPVIAATGLDDGARIGIAFQLGDDKATYAVRGPPEATADWFEAMYRVVA